MLTILAAWMRKEKEELNEGTTCRHHNSKSTAKGRATISTLLVSCADDCDYFDTGLAYHMFMVSIQTNVSLSSSSTHLGPGPGPIDCCFPE